MNYKIGFLFLTAMMLLNLTACGATGETLKATEPNSINKTKQDAVVQSPSGNITATEAAVNKDSTASDPQTDKPERITFRKGESGGEVTVNLAPNRKKRFAVRGKEGQEIQIIADSKSALITMISGTTQLLEDAGGGFVLTIAETGDVVFEVKNTSKKELKTSVVVEILNP